jgi:hypothetical protein
MKYEDIAVEIGLAKSKQTVSNVLYAAGCKPYKKIVRIK